MNLKVNINFAPKTEEIAIAGIQVSPSLPLYQIILTMGQNLWLPSLCSVWKPHNERTNYENIS